VLINLGYPSREDERRIARRYRDGDEPLERVEPIIAPEALLALRRVVSGVVLSDVVEGYVVDLVRATRDHKDLRLGASPRTKRRSLPCQPGLGRP